MNPGDKKRKEKKRKFDHGASDSSNGLEQTEQHKKKQVKFTPFEDRFGLYPPRTKDKASVTAGRSILSLPKKTVDVKLPGESTDDETVGYLVAIPVPLNGNYTRGADRHPITIVKKYVKAIRTLNPRLAEGETTEEEVLAYASTRLRVLLCVNGYDNYKDSTKRTEDLASEVTDFVNTINSALALRGYPACLIPTIWSLSKPGSDDFLLEQDAKQWAASYPNEIRDHFSENTKSADKLLKPGFPFASFRTFIMNSPEATEMIQALKRCNKRGVYVLTGDADLVSLHPTGTKKRSIFNAYDRNLSGRGAPSGNSFARLGGAYRFDSDEIARHLERQYGDSLDAMSTCHSVLFTHLAKTLDTAIRHLFGRMDPGLSYYAEPNTAMTVDLYDQAVFRKKDGKKDGALSSSLLSSQLSNPDHTQKITEDIRQAKNWVKGPPRKQLFMASPSAQLVTSSRHDLVIAPTTKERHSAVSEWRTKNGYKKDMLLKPGNTPLGVLEGFTQAHNTQITSSQQNSRWRESGYGPNALHQFVKWLPADRLPFVHALWSKKNNIKPQVRGELEKSDWNSNPLDYSADMLLENILLVSSSPTAENLGFRSFELEALCLRLRGSWKPDESGQEDEDEEAREEKKAKSQMGTQLFRSNIDAFLMVLVQVEYLFQWAARKIEQIRRLKEPVDFLDARRDGSKEQVPSSYINATLFSGTRTKKPSTQGRYILIKPITAYQEMSLGSIYFYYELQGGMISLTGVERPPYIQLALHNVKVREVSFGNQTRNYSTSTLKLFVDLRLLKQKGVIAAQEEAAEQARTRLHQQGYTVHDTQSDGHCLFRAVSTGVHGHQEQHIQLRFQAVQYMRTHRLDFATFDTNYLDRMGDPKLALWGGEPEIIALSRSLDRRIIVHAPGFSRVYPADALYDPEAAKEGDIHIFYNGYNHYEAVTHP